MAAGNGNGETQALQAVAVPEGQDRIYQTLTSKKKTLEDVGLIKFIATYVDQGVHLVKSVLITHETLDKIMNILEDEVVG